MLGKLPTRKSEIGEVFRQMQQIVDAPKVPVGIPGRGFQVHADRFSAPLRSSAARAAHRWQASSHICCNVPMPVRPWLPALFVRRDIESSPTASPQWIAKRQGLATQNPQAMARCNKCGSWLASDAPRGRRSISRTLQGSRQAPGSHDAISCQASLPSDGWRQHQTAAYLDLPDSQATLRARLPHPLPSRVVRRRYRADNTGADRVSPTFPARVRRPLHRSSCGGTARCRQGARYAYHHVAQRTSTALFARNSTTHRITHLLLVLGLTPLHARCSTLGHHSSCGDRRGGACRFLSGNQIPRTARRYGTGDALDTGKR